MRIPRIYRRVDELSNEVKINTIEIPEETFDKSLPYSPDVDFDDKKSIASYVKSIKYMIRQSREYTAMMKFLKDKRQMNGCFFLPNVKKYRGSKVRIEVHHTGLTMEDIVMTILMKRYKNDEDYSYQAVAKEVMLAHYNGWVSLTSLSETIHELIHSENSGLFIPLHMCDIGDATIFYDEYKEYMDRDLIKKFEQYKVLSSAIENIEDIIPDYLERKYIYYKRQGVEIPDMDKLLEIIDL